MARPDPSHPDQRAERIAGTLRGVDISGGASTIGRDRMTIGDTSRINAVKSGMDTSSPLLDAYRRWRDAQEADPDVLKTLRADLQSAQDRLVKVTATDRARARDKQAKKAVKQLRRAKKAAALTSPAAIEGRAVRKSLKRTRDALAVADDVTTALQVGFRHYRNQGGTTSFAMWKRRIVS
ncbi:MAG TPA: hypothetical protein VNF71_07040 [Acidimicrobiales bacterium]|nr:hypothetical protein [Acidimicrobiales bacterium]